MNRKYSIMSLSLLTITACWGADRKLKITDLSDSPEAAILHKHNAQAEAKNMAQQGTINKADKHGRTPLMRAALANDSYRVNALLQQGADLSTIDNDGNTALDIAIRRDAKAEIIQMLTGG